MSAVSPLVADWIRRGLRWRYVYSPKALARTIDAGEMVKISEHRYPEGTLIIFAAFFDSPYCGARMRAGPMLDTERTHTIIDSINLGLTTPNVNEWAVCPPRSRPGFYGIYVAKEWPWLDYVEFYVYNNDDEPHMFLGYGYTLMVLEQRREIPRELEEYIRRSQAEAMARGVTP